MTFDSVDIDKDFAVRTSSPRDATELRRAEEGIWVSIEAGCDRPDAQHEPRDRYRGDGEKETAASGLSAYCIDVRIRGTYLENTAVCRI